MRTSTCACGAEIVAKDRGPMPKFCPDCRRERNCELQAGYRATLAEHRAERQVACLDCGAPLPWAGKGRPRLRCTPCLAEWTRSQASTRYSEWRAADPERARESDRRSYDRRASTIRAAKLEMHFARRYGLTAETLAQMVEDQNGCCLICGREPNGKGGHARLHVDHCHSSGRVRGLLCGNCNTMIGLAAEDPQILLAAVEYLQKEQVNGSH